MEAGQANANVFFVGLMGAGKTTVGRAVARRLQRSFIDSDHEIEARTGARIPVIWEVEGEEGFRQREADVIDELSRRENIVLATGGGAILRPENREHLKSRGLVIYLRVSAPINRQLTGAIDRSGVAVDARALQKNWDAVITARAVLQGAALTTLCVTLLI